MRETIFPLPFYGKRKEIMALLIAGLVTIAFAAGVLLGFEWPKLREMIKRRLSKMEVAI